MRRVFLAGAAALPLLAAPMQPAHAIFGVGDIVSDPAALAKLIDQISEIQRRHQAQHDAARPAAGPTLQQPRSPR